MAETEDKSPINVPWVPLLAVLAAVAGLTTALLSSRSARPPAPIDSAVTGPGKVSARLWQDPLSVAREAAARPDAVKLTPGLAPLADEYDALADVPATSPPIVLVACEPNSPYAEDVERRVRDRAAVLHALAAEGYLPEESTALRYVRVNPQTVEVLPYESFHNLDRSTKPAVMVIWLADGVLDETKGGMLHQLANLGNELIKGSTTLRQKRSDGSALRPALRVLGPNSSPQYRLMLEGVTNDDDKASLQVLRSTRIYSCKASAPEAVLATGISWVLSDPEAIKEPTRQTAVAVTRQAGLENTGFCLTRTICPDDTIMAALWNELAARRVSADSNVAVIAELDSIFGRSATRAFLLASYGTAVHPPNFELEKLRGIRHNLHTFTYMAGLDGALPKNALGAEEAKSKDDNTATRKSDPTDDPTEGLSQVDYLRRLADELAHRNEELRAGKKPFRAVAVLGSDIYDKLQILRTLRPELPNALFLTNNLDARFGHPDEWEETRNLLVASNYPLVPDKSWGSETPPFRDSLQAAVYAATRMALGKERDESRWRGQPLIFEIGRHGAVQLTANNAPARLGNFKARASVWRSIFGCLVCLGALALLLWPSAAPQETPDSTVSGASSRRRFQLIPSRAPALTSSSRSTGEEPHAQVHRHRRWTRSGTDVPLLILLAALLTACRYYLQAGQGGEEPFAVLEGISVWPGDFLRACVLFLACFFVTKTLRDLSKNSDDLEDKFCMLKRADRQAFDRRRLARTQDKHPAVVDPGEEAPRKSLAEAWKRRWFNFWPQTDDYAEDHHQVNIGHLWLQYKAWGRTSARLGRALLLCVLYCLALWFFRLALHEPNPDLPVRGPAFLVSIGLLWSAGLSYVFLTFLVVDATELNWRSIRDLNRHRSDWQSAGVAHRTSDCCFEAHRAFLEPEDAADYLDIEFIARRSDVVNSLVYYPFILFSLLLAARWSITDNYQWSPALLIGFGANAAWAVYCAIRLPLEAKAARRKSLKRLRRKLFVRRIKENTANAESKPPLSVKSSVTALEQVITQIENMNRGAFVGIWEQPVLRAVLLPSGGAGVWALLQLLPH